MADINPRIVLTGVDKTGAAFATATRNLSALQARAAGIGAALSPLLGTVGLLGSALSLVSFKNIVNGVDALNDLKDATGASIENLSALEDIAARTGTSFETVGTALVKFNAQLKEAKPGSGPAEVLKAIGLSAEELRRTDPAEALRLTAVALSAFADDGNKARITQELFGKSIREVAPLLNDLAEQGQLNATVTTAQSEAAKKFNQQMSALEKNIKDAARSLIGDLLPALNSFFDNLNRNGGFSGSIMARLGLDDVSQARSQASAISAEVSRVGDAVARMSEELSRDPGNELLRGRVDKARAKLQGLIKDAGEAANKVKGLADKLAPAANAEFSNEGRNRSKPSAPDVPGKADTAGADKARAEALANLRKITEGRLKAIGEGLEAERDLQRFHEQMSRALYEQGVQSLGKFHADQDDARRANLESVRRAVEQEIAERQKLLASPLLKGKDKLAERQEIENQIEEARAKLRAAEREAQQAGELAAVERQREIRAVTDSLAQLDAQIQSLRGNSAAGDLLDIARQVREAEADLRQGGASDDQARARAGELGQLLEAQRQVNVARENFSRITAKAGDEEERFLRAAQARGDTTLEIEQGLRAIRTEALAQMAEQLRLAEALANAAGPDSPAVEFARQLRLEFERLNAVADPALLRLRAVGDEVADALGKAAGAISINFRDAKSAVKSLGDQLLTISTRELVEKPLTDFFRQQIRGLTEGGGGLAGLAGKIFGVGTASPGQPAAGAAFDLSGVFESITSLGTAAGGSADVLGKLPQLAAIPATTAIGSLGAAAQIAASALGSLSAAATAGRAGASGASLPGLGDLFGGGGFGTGADFGNQDLALFLHRGGIAGVDGDPVRRYHSGGLVGQLPRLRQGEVPAILQGGPRGLREEVLSARDPRHSDNGGGGNTFNFGAIRVDSHGQMDRMAEDRAARNIAKRAERYLSRRGA